MQTTNALKREWRLEKVEFIPIIIGVTGIYNKSLKKNLQKISDNIRIEEIQGEAVKGSVHIIKRALSMNT